MVSSRRGFGLVACVFGLLSACGADDPDPPAAPAPGVTTLALQGPAQALITLQKSLDLAVPGVLKQLSPKDRADLVNALAWFDEDPRTLRAARGVRGQVQHVSSRFLAYDVAPQLPGAPTFERAEAAIASGGIVRALTNVAPGDELKIVSSHGLAAGAKRFVIEQRLAGVRVHPARASFDLNASGRLTRFDGSLLPDPKPASGTLVGSKLARSDAEQHLKSLGEPWKLGPISALESEAVIAHLLETTGKDEARHAWRFLMVVPGIPAARREVLVDRITRGVLVSLDDVKYLDDRDTIRRAAGRIGARGDLGVSLLETVWTGSDGCASVSDPVSGGDAHARDRDELPAALCEAENVFADFGAELGVSDPRFWMDRGEDGVLLGIGATPLLSVAMNAGGTLVFAEGVARAEVVGHEIMHSTASAFGLSGSAEAAAIEEHLGDAFGLLLERRFSARRENDCLMNDDLDSQLAVRDQDLSMLAPDDPLRPCATAMLPRPWRNACNPSADNGGWCEGASSYRHMAFNKYDAYGDTSARRSTHVASHTNLGIGNRIVTSLLGEAATVPHLVSRLPDDDVMRLVLGTVQTAGNDTDWSKYAATLIEVARGLAPGASMGHAERQVRAALANADIWSMPSPIMPRMSPGETPSTPAPPPDTRPAVATVALTGEHAGRERTFVFYKPNAGNSVHYVWRDDVSGGASAELGDSWIGPCALPGASTAGSPAAAGSAQSLFVAWGEPTATPGESLLRGLRISGETASEVSSGCGFDWQDNDPIAERKLQGSPAITVWGASEYLTLCEVLKEDFPGLAFPFRTLGAMGLQIGDCVDIGERVPPWVHDYIPKQYGPEFFDLLSKLLDAAPSLGLPQPGDPWAPRLPDFDPGFGARIDLVSQLRADQDMGSAFRKLPKPLGPRFAEALDRYGASHARGVEAVIQQKVGFDKDDFPEGSVQTIDLRFFDDVLVVAFKDEDGKLRATTWTDIAPTGDIAVLDDAPLGDPSLTQARTLTVDDHGHRLEANFLYAVYGTRDTVAGTPRPRLEYRVATSFDPDLGGLRDESFEAAARIDDFVETVGVRRKRDYRFVRSWQTPVVAGGNRRLHVFTVARQNSGEQPDDTTTGDVSPLTDRIRSTVFEVRWDGKLLPSSERPVTVSRTRLTRSLSGGQAGAAIASTDRRRVRWFYANGDDISMRSAGEP